MSAPSPSLTFFQPSTSFIFLLDPLLTPILLLDLLFSSSDAILARFPLAKKGVIGSGINSKLSEIRFRSRKANRDPRFI